LKYSILIPTRNGIYYLKHAIETVLNQSENDVELIVSDNHSSDGTWDYLQSLNDPRLVCVQPPFAMSMVKHWEFLLEKPKGEWVVLIGDDDGLQPYFFQYCNQVISQHPTASIISSPRAYYFWEGSEIFFKGTVMSYSVLNKPIEIKQSKDALKDLLFSNSEYFEYPQVYTSTLVRKSVIEHIKLKQNGVFFNSITPDANGVIALLRNVQEYIYTPLPICWVGTSKKSTGFSTTANNNNDNSPKKDFKNLNLKDGIFIHHLFPNLLKIFDSQLFFLEAWYKNDELYKQKTIPNTFFYKHFVFTKPFANLKSKYETSELKPLINELLKEHRLNIKLLSILKYYRIAYHGAFRFIKKKTENLFMKLFKTRLAKKEFLIELNSTDRKSYSTIIDACHITMQCYNEVDLIKKAKKIS